MKSLRRREHGVRLRVEPLESRHLLATTTALGSGGDWHDPGTWDQPEASPSRCADEVYVREGWRCFAPGCTSRSSLEDHHREYRSRGGDA